MTRFVVDLGNLKLSDEQKQSIEASIQDVVMSHLGEIGDRPRRPTYFPPEWLGLIIRERFEELGDSVAEIGKFALRGR
ncbi:hypothetical protein LG047_16040 [Methylocystis sp. WRRC1]|uniref:hypothetical protein n=1 Tax=unclassified Methylocystis TaxID=2625913 RepID=UPI0001F87162|nr:MULTISPECIES: hypothetical protein [unclassified Methylocystis]MCC3246808.1 hypothetical protein [Methylocystis sp. WRRC1]